MGAKNPKKRKKTPTGRAAALRPSRKISNRVVIGLVCIFLAAIVWLAFQRTLRCDFVNYDDDQYVYANPIITNGLTLSGIQWAFTHVHASNWHPLTTISHMLDCSLYGLQPWGHHLTNIVLHATAAVLLFLALLRLTSASDLQLSTLNDQPSASNIWACAFVAALFAVHPLRVESVAWVSERKDVLSGVFFMLTLLAYARYARLASWDDAALPRQSGAATTRLRKWPIGSYLTVVILFALGLMCKPTLVTLPLVLLLLDYWPLGRWQGAGNEEHGGKSEELSAKSTISAFQTSRGLVIEKLALFALSAASCAATVIAQKDVIERSLQMNFIERANNAFISYAAYLGEMIWPAHLVVSHPYGERYRNLAQVVVSLILLSGISAICFLSRKKYPFLLTGWLWYIGVLVPMIGLVQVSGESRSDRYTYLAQIGVYIMVSWGAMALIKKWRPHRAPLAATAMAVIIALAICSYGQTAYWRDTETLWRHALDVSPDDYLARDNLGYTLLQKGKINEAIAEYEKAIQIKPGYARAHNNLGNALMQTGQLTEAAAQYQKVLELEPHDSQVHNNMGTLLIKQGRVDEAIEQYRKAVAADPETAELHYNLGSALIVKGNWDDAINHLEAALTIDPNFPEAHNKLGVAFGETGRINEAIGQFGEALRLHHLYPQAQFNLGSILVRIGQRQEGIAHLLEAVRLKPDYAEAKERLRNLGVPLPR